MCRKLYFPRSQLEEQTLVVLNGTNIFLVGLYIIFGTSYVEFGTEVWLVPFGII